MRVLIHVCCAPCLAKTLAGLRAEFGNALDAHLFFYNPNIHPLLEFRRRLKAVHVYRERDPLPLESDETYGLLPFCHALHPDYEPALRCPRCYRMRLARTAARAAAQGFPHFTSTLITSQHQDHAQIRAAGEAEARGASREVHFLYRDLREVEAPESMTRGLYSQQYCGCVFSEAERFGSTAKHLYKGAVDSGNPAKEC